VSDLRTAWEHEAERWAAWARTPGHDAWFWRLNWPAFTTLLPPPGRRTLDLGCGEGRGGRWLAEHGHHVTGVDGSPTLAGHAREAGGFAEVLVADAAALPLPDASFDLVCAFMSLHDLDDLDGALAEVHRVLEPGGRLCAAVMHPMTSQEWAAADAGYFPERRYTETMRHGGLEMTFHGMHRTLERYAGALRGAGMLVEDVREPRPAAELVADRPDLADAARRPQFLQFLALRG
jgi:SAM-dependent methyltransferase